jgi:cell division protease FtsH
MKQSFKTLLLWVFSILLLITAFNFFMGQKEASQALSFTEFIQLVKEDKIVEVTFRGKEKIYGKFVTNFREGSLFHTIGDTSNEYFIKILADAGLVPAYESDERGSFWKVFFINYLPIILIFLFLFFIYKQIQVGGGKALSFGKSRARLQKDGAPKVTFEDVAGIDEAKVECEEIIEFLKNPKKFSKLGGRIPKGVLLMGSPGTGKTLLAKAIAGEAGVPFFSISGSDFVEMFVGVGASRVRDLFDQGKKNAPCIVFIDEIDAVGRHRGAGLGGGHDEREQTLNQLLVEMDGFEANAGVILVAATNRPDVLDPALLRPGRFDRRIMVPLPDAKGRLAILKVHTRKVPLEEGVHLDGIAKGTPGFSGADIENLVNEGALIAARRNHEKVSLDDIEFAKDKILMGAERRSMVLTEEEKRTTSYHESGHTLVAKLLPNMDPIHKVSIIPRGRALGVTQTLPSEEKYTMTKKHAENMISFMMGGRVAEEIIFGHKTTGAGDDIDKATTLARRMVCEWGMSDRLGPVAFGKKDEHIFLGKSMDRGEHLSEHTQEIIDQEIKNIIEIEHERTMQLLRENLSTLHNLAKALIEREVLQGKEVDMVIAGKTLPPMKLEEELKISDPPKAKAVAEKKDVPLKKSPLKIKPEPGKA